MQPLYYRYVLAKGYEYVKQSLSGTAIRSKAGYPIQLIESQRAPEIDATA
jgi:hypothetical protein